MVHGFRISGDRGIGQVDGFPLSVRGLTGNAKFANRLTALILNPQTYNGTHSACTFNPTVAFRVWSRKSATILICFGCNEIKMLKHAPDVPLKDIDGVKARFRVEGNFSLFRPELFELTKEMLPHDSEIQALPLYDTGLSTL